MIKLAFLCPKACLYISQAFTVSELSKSHTQILIEAGEGLNLMLSFVTRHTTTKSCKRQMFHKLRKYELASMHVCLLQITVLQDGKS